MKEIKTFIFSVYKESNENGQKLVTAVQLKKEVPGFFSKESFRESLPVDIDYKELKQMIEVQKWRMINVIPLTDYVVQEKNVDITDRYRVSPCSVLIMEREIDQKV